jgi:hypothetical protein
LLDSAAGSQGAKQDNMHPAKSNSPPPTHVGGEDTIHVSLGVCWSKDGFPGLMQLLRRCQLAARGSDTDDRSFFLIDNYMVRVHPYGRKGNGGPAYKFHLTVGGIEIFIQERDEPSDRAKIANVFVEVGSAVLVDCGGIEWVWPFVCSTLRSLGGEVVWDRVSRADWCVDAVGVDTAEWVQAFLQLRYVARALSGTIHFEGGEESTGEEALVASLDMKGRRPTGFTLGRGSIRFRCYDKIRELKDKRSVDKEAVMVDRRWGGVLPEKAMRNEFQLRREALHALGIESVKTLVLERQAVLRYLCTSWLRFTEAVPDRANTLRARVWSEWEKFREAFERIGGVGRVVAAVRRKSLANTQLFRMALGCAASAAAIEGLAKTPELLLERMLTSFGSFFENSAGASALWRKHVARHCRLLSAGFS